MKKRATVIMMFPAAAASDERVEERDSTRRWKADKHKDVNRRKMGLERLKTMQKGSCKSYVKEKM